MTASAGPHPRRAAFVRIRTLALSGLAVASILFACAGWNAAGHRELTRQAVEWIDAGVDGGRQATPVDFLGPLLAKGVDLCTETPSGRTVLMYASNCGFEPLAREAIRAGQDPNHHDVDGVTPLICAANGDSLPIARLLVEAGAKVSARSHEGTTALWYAVVGTDVLMATFLIENGARTELVPAGETLLAHAIDNHGAAMIRILYRAGARPAELDFREARRVGDVRISRLLHSLAGPPDIATK